MHGIPFFAVQRVCDIHNSLIFQQLYGQKWYMGNLGKTDTVFGFVSLIIGNGMKTLDGVFFFLTGS
jgi:hypothetical protein